MVAVQLLPLFYIVSKCYNVKIWKMIRKAPRFGILLAAIILAMAFTTMDIAASIFPRLSPTDGINPYWKLALIFKALTDNIMLDDFKSVLQRLGAMKLDGTEAMRTNSLNITPDEKAGAADDEYDVVTIDEPQPSPVSKSSSERSSRSSRYSMSGRLLDDGEALDWRGRARRKQSFAATTIGRLGVRAVRLPRLPGRQSRSEKEAQRNMAHNQSMMDPEKGEGFASPRRGNSNASRESKRSQRAAREQQHQQMLQKEPWEQLNFITALEDTEPSSNRRHS